MRNALPTSCFHVLSTSLRRTRFAGAVRVGPPHLDDVLPRALRSGSLPKNAVSCPPTSHREGRPTPEHHHSCYRDLPYDPSTLTDNHMLHERPSHSQKSHASTCERHWWTPLPNQPGPLEHGIDSATRDHGSSVPCLSLARAQTNSPRIMPMRTPTHTWRLQATPKTLPDPMPM